MAEDAPVEAALWELPKGGTSVVEAFLIEMSSYHPALLQLRGQDREMRELECRVDGKEDSCGRRRRDCGAGDFELES